MGWAVLCLAVCMLGLGLSATADDHKPIITTFDPLGSYGTQPWSISDTGWITGDWYDVNGVERGFVRAPDGTITTFDVATVVPGTTGCQGCEINSKGEVAGCFWNSIGNSTGFRRTPDGKITPIYGAPDAGTGPNQGSMAMALNDAGLILGQDTISDTLQYSLLVTPDNHFIIFNPPGTTWSWGGMESALNPAGAAIGGYVNLTTEVYYGYVRAPYGAITELIAPSAGSGEGEGTFPEGISPNGTIVGFVQDNHELTHGFIRTPDGRYALFNVLGAGTVPDTWEGTYAFDINQAGTITGWWADANWTVHAFLMTPDGRITSFDGPNASTAAGLGTQPYAINSAGAITGFYYDSSGISHGFLGLPPRR
jgi:hypothetical protein